MAARRHAAGRRHGGRRGGRQRLCRGAPRPGSLGAWRGVFGKAQAADAPLADGDRVEIYRGLSFDPKESRRRRAEHRRALAARGGKARPAGLL